MKNFCQKSLLNLSSSLFQNNLLDSKEALQVIRDGSWNVKVSEIHCWEYYDTSFSELEQDALRALFLLCNSIGSKRLKVEVGQAYASQVTEDLFDLVKLEEMRLFIDCINKIGPL